MRMLGIGNQWVDRNSPGVCTAPIFLPLSFHFPLEGVVWLGMGQHYAAAGQSTTDSSWGQFEAYLFICERNADNKQRNFDQLFSCSCSSFDGPLGVCCFVTSSAASPFTGIVRNDIVSWNVISFAILASHHPTGSQKIKRGMPGRSRGQQRRK